MSKLKIYEPAMCCETGVCGVDADAVLITFTADIEWLKKQGVSVERFNLAQEPAAFISDTQIKAEINEKGETCLPLLMLEDRIISRGSYPDRSQLTALTGLEISTLISESPVIESQTDCGCGSGSC